MRSPTIVFTKCLKIKLKVNMESQKAFVAVIWADWELWRLPLLLHRVGESPESPAQRLIPVHQADYVSRCWTAQFPTETAMWAVTLSRKIRYNPSVSRLLQVYKTGLNYQSTSSCCLVEFAQVFQREVAKATVNCAVEKTPPHRHAMWHPHTYFCCRRWRCSATLSHLCHRHIQPLANRSQALSCCFCPYPWSDQDSSALLALQATGSSRLLTAVASHQALLHEAPSVHWLQVENHYRDWFYLYTY